MAKILLIDDDESFTDAMQVVLEANGYSVAVAHSREEGMLAVEKEKPDVMVLDVMMGLPDDGFTMSQELRKRGAKIPILMLSSIGKITGMTFEKDAEMVPVDAFEEKPISPKRLLEKIGELLKK
jgi:DNA-binding response OmpR family regulator